MAERPNLTEFGRPQVVEAFSGLKTITRRYKIQGEGLRVANIDDPAKGFRDYATADDEFPNALLINFRTEQVNTSPNTIDLILTEIYSEFEAGQKTPVGEDVITYGESNQKQITKKYVVKATDAESTAAAIGAIADTLACNGVVITKNGVGATIAETYIASGKLSEVTRESNGGRLITKTLTYYNAIPPTPDGYVLIDTGVQNPDGIPSRTYTFVKGLGTIRDVTSTESDGAFVRTIVTYSAAAATPTSPGGDYHLISLANDPEDGYFKNTAVYKKPPDTVSYRKQVSWERPGVAGFTGTQLTLRPPTTLRKLATVEVSYNTAQITDVPFTVESYCAFVENYTPTATGSPKTSQRGLGGYLSEATMVSGTNSAYNGVLCDEYQAVLVSSDPAARPTGTVIISVDNDDYLVSLSGTKVFRRTKVTIAL